MAIAVATIKKLEKELLDYDLSNELTVVYKSLKKLNINSPEYYNYSQLYNKHVAYMLAIDKAEDLLSEYFKKFGNYSLSGLENDKLELTLLNTEMNNVRALYESHRLYVYQSCMTIFHRLFVEKQETLDDSVEPIEDMLDKVEQIFNTYPMDSIYYHLNLVFEFLKLEYYNHYKVYRKAEKHFEEINDAVSNLMTNYSQYSFPAQFLITKIERHIRMGAEREMYEENEHIFEDFECDNNDIPKYVTYVVYRSLCCYFIEKYDEAARWINNLLNEVSLKKYPFSQLEIKVILALQYCLMDDYDLFNQLINSIQRQIRILGKENCEHVMVLTKMLKISISENKKQKGTKISQLIPKFNRIEKDYFTPTFLIKMDDDFVRRLS